VTKLSIKTVTTLVTAIVSLATLCSPAWGSPTLLVVGRGNGLFEVMGQGFERVGGIDMTLVYDHTASTNPRVTQGELIYGAMMVPNLAVPGTIKVGIVSHNPQGISGNGSIVKLSLSPVVGAEGALSSFTARIVDLKGVDIPVQIQNTTQAAGKSIPTLFREYAGPRTPAAMTVLITGNTPSGVRQEPLIALSDGTSKVKVSLDMPVGAKSPNFALNGATLVSLRREGDLYLLEVIPDAGVYEARITILNNGSITEVPLTVTQPLNPAFMPGGILNETALGLYLKGEPGKRSDLNGDGKVDYLDDYIITANYLIIKQKAVPKLPMQFKPPPPASVPGAGVQSVK
jgi:hypothetical protein